MLDLTLLRILKVKANYDRIVPNLPEGALDKKTEILIKDLGKFLEETGHPVVKMGAFKAYFFNFLHPKLTKEQADYYAKLIDNLAKDVDPDTTRAMTNRLIEVGFATDIGNIAADYHAGKEIDVIHTVGYKHDAAKARIMTKDAKELIVTADINDLLKEDEDMTGLQFNLQCLRNHLRPLRPSDLVLVCGRPGVGKTTFLASELMYMVHGVPDDRPIIWLNNEGIGSRIVKRLYSTFLGADTKELLAMSKEGSLHEKFHEVGGDKIKVIDCHGWTSIMAEQVIDDLNPALVIFDMVDNLEFKGHIKGSGDARTDQVLEEQYKWSRELGVKYDHPVIATSQVSAEVEQNADTQCYPPMHCLKDSRTGKQGAADLMIMIGKSADPMCGNDRFISTPKNKLGVTHDPEGLRAQVNIDIQRGRYIDRPGA